MGEQSINFSGITHDHTLLAADGSAAAVGAENCAATIVILRRHPMYDCLVLAKRYRACLEGFSLEFPTTRVDESRAGAEAAEEPAEEPQAAARSLTKSCSGQRLVSRFLDGDDPIYQQAASMSNSSSSSNLLQHLQLDPTPNLAQPFTAPIDDKLDENCQLVHVPINGLIDRLKGYTMSGVAVDSRVYAFAMGLKTAERILTTSSMKELQETPL